ncbi:MAG: nitrite reductase, partial [Gammaproteobacteria bacterium]|nr:nitrite reductase [Gammaproteobacteria bacterium]
AATAEVEKTFTRHCAECHGADRLGGMGPALLPENLRRLRRGMAQQMISEGRAATQMPAYGGTLSAAQIEALVDYIYTPLATVPEWGLDAIRASRKIHLEASALSDKPVYHADPLNLFLVVELEDHHATVLDGDSFTPLDRFATPFAVHGGPKYSPDGRFVYLASRDGWIRKYDMYNLKIVADVRAGINTRNVAISGDGRYLMVGNYLPHNVVILDARDLSPLQLIPTRDEHGTSSRVSAVYTAPPRGSFIVALKDLPEVWEIPYHEKATALPVYRGPMHDYRAESGEESLADTRDFPVRRIRLEDYLDDFFFDRDYRHLIGASRNGKGQVINLTVGQRIAELELQGMPHLGSGITWSYQGRDVLATPNLKEGTVTIIDMQNWQTIKTLKTLGPGFFMRSHDNSRYAWVDVFFGKERDAVHIIDKEKLAIVKTLRPAPGKTSAHVEFTRDGSHALLSIWDKEGAVIVYDANTLQEVTRLPMRKPSGKYNVYNKTRYEGGTSH